ncbi:MAG TPA: molybdopterin dinucleotide binding domain-containing protein, partial [Gammaproteobacteria bacterium]
NHGSRDLDLGPLGSLSELQYQQLAPTQWPLTTQPGAATPRPFADGRFFTASSRARFIAVTPQPPACSSDDTLPLVLNTGRLRDQWHTMSRSGKSVRLASHSREPCAEIHPHDAARYGIVDDALVTVSGRQGRVIVRARISEQQRPGSLFVPIHWNGQFSSAARVGALVNACTDPLSGQPESKHAPARIAPYQPAWHGFLLSRRRLTPAHASYWCRSRGNGLWRYRLPGEQLPQDWAQSARALLCSPGQDVGWVEYLDPATCHYRAARIVNGRLESCLYIGPDHHLPEHDWLESLFASPTLSGNERTALLGGKALSPQEKRGPTVCACFGVGRDTLRNAIREHGLNSIEAIAARLKAGSNCGSCIPELRTLLAEGETIQD